MKMPDNRVGRWEASVINALRRWARDELRSVNSQVDYLLRSALRDAGRLPAPQAGEQDGR